MTPYLDVTIPTASVKWSERNTCVVWRVEWTHRTAALDCINTAERLILLFLAHDHTLYCVALEQRSHSSTLLSFKWPTVSNKAFHPRLFNQSSPSFVPRANILLTQQILSPDSVWSRSPALVSSLLSHWSRLFSTGFWVICLDHLTHHSHLSMRLLLTLTILLTRRPVWFTCH